MGVVLLFFVVVGRCVVVGVFFRRGWGVFVLFFVVFLGGGEWDFKFIGHCI